MTYCIIIVPVMPAHFVRSLGPIEARGCFVSNAYGIIRHRLALYVTRCDLRLDSVHVGIHPFTETWLRSVQLRSIKS